MNELGRVTDLWRYPGNSLAGEARQSIDIDSIGVLGDRLFGLVDVKTGAIARPDADRKWHPVPRINIRHKNEGSFEIATPESGWLAAPSSECDEAVSDFLGFKASIRPTGKDIAAGYSGPLTEGRYKKAPIHLLTTASMAQLKTLHPSGDPDPRRFRPNIVVDMPAIEGHFPETEWIGRRLGIGEVEMTISEPCRRCGFTIIAQDGFDDDPEILRQLVRHNAHNFGIYCTIDRPGCVEIGDVMWMI